MKEQNNHNELHIRIAVDGIEFDAKGDAEFIERERIAFEATLLPLGVAAVSSTGNRNQHAKVITTDYKGTSDNLQSNEINETYSDDFSKMSLASFTKQFNVESNQDFIIFAAYFNERKNKINSFSSELVKKFYSEAKKPLPSNISMEINRLTAKGLIMIDESTNDSKQKMYILTSNGEEFVNRYSQRNKTVKKSPVKSKQRKMGEKKESEYSIYSFDDLNGSKYPALKTFSDFKDKMLLALYILRVEKNGEWFKVSDVEYLLSDIWGESVTINQINGVFKNNKTWFKAEKVGGSKKELRRKLLIGGIDFAKSLLVS